jgi:hypothetical protein
MLEKIRSGRTAMTRLLVGFVAVVLFFASLSCVGTGKGGMPQPDPSALERSPWGEEKSGLQCRFTAPARIEQGMPLEAEVHLRCEPNRLPAGVTRLSQFLIDGYISLVLADRSTGKTVTVGPYDPTAGMPMQDTGEAGAPLDGSTIKPFRAGFPLVTVRGALEVGVYEARVQYDFPGSYRQSWWRGTPAQRDAFWKGKVISGPLEIEILKATPKTAAYLLPKCLRLLPGLKIGYSSEDAEKVEVKLRNGFFVGTEITSDPAGGMTLMSGTPRPDDANPIGEITGYEGGDRKLSYTIEVFETADRPEHMWHPSPNSGDYRVLWKKTLSLTLSEEALRESMGTGPGR